MPIGFLNPGDVTHSTASRPPPTLNAVNERRWFSDALATRVKDQDFNTFLGLIRHAVDFYSITDTEGDDTLLRQAIQAGASALTGNIAAFQSLVGAVDRVPYWTSNTVMSTFTATSYTRTLLAKTSLTQWQDALGISASSNPNVIAFAGLAGGADQLPYFTGVGTMAQTGFTTAARTLLDDADITAMRTTLGLGTAATANTGTSGNNVPFLSGTNIWSEVNTFTRADVTAPLVVQSTASGASVGPYLDLIRTSPAPGANDGIGGLRFYGRDSTLVQTLFAEVQARAATVTDATEAGRLILRTAVAGAMVDGLTLNAGVQVGTPAGGDKGAGTLNATTLYEGGISITTKFVTSASPTFTGLSTFADLTATGTITTATAFKTSAAFGLIAADTADAADNKNLSVAGGGVEGAARGAYLTLSGNEHAATAGRFTLSAGTTAVASSIIGGAAANTILTIMNATADGADTGHTSIGGGGIIGSTRGAYLILYGNEHASGAGRLTLSAGDTSIATTIIGGNVANTAVNIHNATVDGSDFGLVQISGGGAVTNTTRGAYLQLAGNEYASAPGIARLYAGLTATSLQLIGGAAAATVIQINNSTADAADSGYVAISGGGTLTDINRGSYINSYGNEHATFPGQLRMVAGTTGYVYAADLLVGAATGGAKGLGTLNAAAIYENNVRVATLGANTFTAAQTITVTTAGTNALTVTSTDAGATAGPLLSLYRDSATPAVTDGLGSLGFSGKDSGGTVTLYASLQAYILDPTDASEDGSLRIYTMQAGSISVLTAAFGPGLYLGAVAGGDKGLGTINATGYYLNNVAFSAAATTAIGTSGATIPLLNAANTWSAAQTITSTALGAVLTLQTTENGALAGPSISLHRISADAAANDVLGTLTFIGRNSVASNSTYASLYSQILDPTSGSEDGRLYVYTMQGGALTVALSVATGLTVGAAVGGDKGVGTLNTQGTIYQNNVALASLAFVADAPSDSVTYGRRNGAWFATGAGGLAEAPNDGVAYTRKSTTWAALSASDLGTGTLPDARLTGSYTGLVSLTLSGNIITSALNAVIYPNTVDTTDTNSIVLAGGGGGAATSSARGAYVGVYGNEHASLAGRLELASGSSGDIRLTGTNLRWTAASADDFWIYATTADGSDIKGIGISAGGGLTAPEPPDPPYGDRQRGAYIYLAGTDMPDYGGMIDITAGWNSVGINLLGAGAIGSGINVLNQTVDGADHCYVGFGSGGGYSASGARGAEMWAYGNEYPGVYAGRLDLMAGTLGYHNFMGGLGVVVGAATGGAKGLGTINVANALYVANVRVPQPNVATTWTALQTFGNVNVASGTITANAPALDVSQTWNNAAVAFTAIKVNVTKTAAAFGSNLLSLQVGGVNMFTVSDLGVVQAGLGFLFTVAPTDFLMFEAGVLGWMKGNLGKWYLYGVATANQAVLRISSDLGIGWNSTTDMGTGAIDTLMLRSAPGVVNLNGGMVLAAGTLTASKLALDITQTWNNAAVTFTAIKANITNTASANTSALLDLQVGGVSKFSIGRGGDFYAPGFLMSGTPPTIALAYSSADGYLYAYSAAELGRWELYSNGLTNTAVFTAASDMGIGWNSTNNLDTGSADLTLFRDAANILAQRNLANAQTLRVYATTDATNTNFSRGALSADATRVSLAAQKGGTGTDRGLRIINETTAGILELGTNSTVRWQIDAAGHLMATIDNTYDIGALAATRPRSIYANQTVAAGTVSASNVCATSFAVFGGAATSSTTRALFAAGIAGVSSARITAGVAPTTPVDGDIWFTGTALMMRVGGVTKTITMA